MYFVFTFILYHAFTQPVSRLPKFLLNLPHHLLLSMVPVSIHHIFFRLIF
ncbi:MAG: hypothetical protein AVDCRST_MAG96-4016 [uncultured Segetibacter sp.]|uniref:Uncharacterized protein n=1 Tax=uncultured Segetibacter sp. TaxID=481133 RepID=A0A6J4U0X2_9BACT|nr:MAG: hypothetical protein AVDCRST_MAG96-4016 [uncultured Segetibacter sp.]